MTIQVGDLVIVVRGMPCCGHLTGAEGKIFEVTAFHTLTQDELCENCYTLLPKELASHGLQDYRPIANSRLQKIPPLSELESSTEYTTNKEPEYVFQSYESGTPKSKT